MTAQINKPEVRFHITDHLPTPVAATEIGELAAEGRLPEEGRPAAGPAYYGAHKPVSGVISPPADPASEGHGGESAAVNLLV